MFDGMLEITPGTQITEKTHIKIYASQPEFRNRASDWLAAANHMPGQNAPANQHGPQHGNLSATQAIADPLELYLSHTSPWGL